MKQVITGRRGAVIAAGIEAVSGMEGQMRVGHA
jgi:hypothetical protein